MWLTRIHGLADCIAGLPAQDVQNQEEGSSPEEPQQEAVAAVSALHVLSWRDEDPREIVELRLRVSSQRSREIIHRRGIRRLCFSGESSSQPPRRV